MTRDDRRSWFVACSILLAVLAAPEAHAQSAEAELLFREGRKLIKLGKLEAGCDKLEASERLESSVGTLLNLGDCREKLGRVASAWAAFRKAEALAKLRDEPRRRNEASRRAQALEHKLPHLAIMMMNPPPGLVVKRDGEVIDPVVWNRSVPIDPDTYTIVAEAPGHKPWRTEIRINGRLKRNTITIPALDRAPVATAPDEKLAPTELPPPVAAPIETVVPPPRDTRGRWTTARKVALGAGIAGVVAAGAGVYFGVRASDYEDRSNDICPDTICDDPEGLRLNDRAQDAALTANVLYVVGGIGLATAGALWFIGAPDDETVITPTVGPDHAGVSFAGTF
jgi:hypothetical protein